MRHPTPNPEYRAQTVSRPLTLRPVLGAFLDAPDEEPAAPDARRPAQECIGLAPLTFWVGDRALSSRWYPPGLRHDLQKSDFFDHALHVWAAGCWPWGPRARFMRLHLGALATTYHQLQTLLDLRDRHRGGVPLLLAGEGRVVLDMGHHWLDVDEDVRTYLRGNDPAAPAFFRVLFDEAVRPLLALEDTETVARFLESIPGIRGELREDPRGDVR